MSISDRSGRSLSLGSRQPHRTRRVAASARQSTLHAVEQVEHRAPDLLNQGRRVISRRAADRVCVSAVTSL
eukprot:796702-Heterocapsa_arctica.AAC.1